MATVRIGDVEWDDAKAAQNEKKHRVTFIEAMECFLDPHGVELADPRFRDRILLIAVSRAHRILCVVYAERSQSAIIRIISARRATRHEKKFYENEP
jgi:uncharacterized DUF497 family protein